MTETPQSGSWATDPNAAGDDVESLLAAPVSPHPVTPVAPVAPAPAHAPATPPGVAPAPSIPAPVLPSEPPAAMSPTAAVEPPPSELPPLPRDEHGKVHINDLLVYMIEVRSSDLHVKAGSPPTIRISGHLIPLDYPVLHPDECQALATEMMGKKELAQLEEKGETDFAYSLPGVGRFRVNIHRQRGSLGIAARRILPHAPDFQSLNLPPAVETLANEHRGLLLVTGPTSSGKTTTCGAIIRHINQTRRCHIVTIEDPIEILHPDEQAVVTQREVGQDTMNFLNALRAAMRQDPDVIFVGEIRDTETVQAALQAAETGHFVLATLHTTDVTETINRIIDFFPAHQQKQVRVGLAGSIAGVITQRLLPKVGGGRTPAIEIMIMNGRIRDCILDPERTHDIIDIVKQSGFYGMQTFNQSLIDLYRRNLVSLEDAKNASSNPHDLQLSLQQAGILDV